MAAETPPAAESGACPACGHTAHRDICAVHVTKDGAWWECNCYLFSALVPSPPDAGRMSWEECGKGMMRENLALYDKCLDTPGFAYYFNALFVEARRAREAEERLREAIIKNAPHAEECRTRPRRSGDERGWLPASGVCDCWKSAALEGRTK